MPSCSKRQSALRLLRRPRAGWANPLLERRAACRLALALSLLLLPLALVAATNTPVPVFHGSLRAASEAAAADQSLVLLVFGADWCAPCKELKSKTLASPEFGQQGGALHVAEVDLDSEPGLARSYGVNAVPTLVLLAPDNKIVARTTGFMHTADLLLWLREGRDRVKEGKWEGTAPGNKLDEFIAKAAADRLDTNDLARLAALLGECDPAERDAVARLLLGQREAAVGPLIGAVTNSYLGARIAAGDLLRQLAPETLGVDPWQSPAELAGAAGLLKKWWAETGKLPAPKEVRELDPVAAGSIKAAVEALRSDDPPRRTAAMSALVSQGAPALPAVREAIRSSERTGDQRSVGLLEDVRWAILIPDTVEHRAVGARAVLARGKGPERQGAATRLGRAGRAAIPALAELVNDADPLVVESAVRALSGLGGKDAIPALAALLRAADSNLRMTAAQALGRAKDLAAVKELLTVLGDPNEVVACTALSALEEVNAQRGYANTSRPQPSEVVNGLRTSLADSRWRVRAAAAEVAGKLGVKELIAQLKGLLEDADGFVAKSALGALRLLSATPEPDKLAGLARRHAGLRGEAVELLVISGAADAVQAVTEMYNAGAFEARLAIVGSLGAAEQPDKDSTAWQPLFARVALEPDARLRRAAAEALGAQSAKLAAAIVGPFLADDDPETRSLAAAVVLRVISGERFVQATSHSQTYFEPLDEVDTPSPAISSRSSRTNQPAATPAQLAAWHAALQQKAGAAPDLFTAAAIFATGQSNRELPVLEHALERADKTALAHLARSPALAAVLPRLPWPDGQPVCAWLCREPALFLRALNHLEKLAPAARDFFLEPARFRAAVEPASLEELASALPQLLTSTPGRWSLLSDSPHTVPVLTALLQATNAAWRAAALYSLSQRDDGKDVAPFERALQDSNAWVRAAAVAGLAQAAKDRQVREQRLGPLLADTDKRVAQRAALGLLEPETRAAAEMETHQFEFDRIQVWSYTSTTSEQRPLATLSNNPAFLTRVRHRLATAAADDAPIWALLLAQYGDFSGLDQLLPGLQRGEQNPGEAGAAVLTAIALSRDAKYLPYLKRLSQATIEESEFRRLLQALKGMTGTEARALRLEINRRLRRTSE